MPIKRSDRAFTFIMIYLSLLQTLLMSVMSFYCAHVMWSNTVGKFVRRHEVVNAKKNTIRHLFKADMNSYLLLQTVVVFFFYQKISKTGYWLGVCDGWFHLQGLPRAARNASRARITKWKKNLFLVRDSNLGPSAYGASMLPLSHDDWCLSRW